MAIIFDVVHGNHTVSNNGLTITDNVSNVWDASSSSSVTSSGKVYWEINVGALSTTTYIMIGAAVAPITSYPGETGSTSWGYYCPDGRKYFNGSKLAYGSAVAKGGTVGVAVDIGAGKIWFSVNGVWQNSGNPATGVNPAFTGISGSIFPAVGLYNSGNSVTGRFTASSLVYPIPSGFTALDQWSAETSIIQLSDEIDDVSLLATSPIISTVTSEEPLDDLVGELLANTVFTVIEEQIDDVSISCTNPIISAVAVDDQVDDVFSYIGEEVASIGFVVSVEERIPDNVSSVFDNTAKLIIVDEEIDEVSIAASTPAVCVAIVSEYKDTIESTASATGIDGSVVVVDEYVDTIQFAASTSSVAIVNVSSGDDVSIASETSPPLVATVAVSEYADVVSLIAVAGIGATVIIVEQPDVAAAHGTAGLSCLVSVDDGADSARIRFSATSVYFEFSRDGTGPQTLSDPTETTDSLSFSYQQKIPGSLGAAAVHPFQFQR